ncbi:MAG: ATP-binding protein [Francisellaceae bacterium]
MKKLPIGISGLEKIIKGDYVYVDKTRHIYTLANTGGGYYFLSRPRRFGKSLLIDTIKEAYTGNKALFKGLFLEDNWDWEVSHPVIHLNFGASSSFFTKQRFFTELDNSLEFHARQYGVTLTQTDYGVKFGELIRGLYEKLGQRVVVLVDEYDKPILDNLHDSDVAYQMREILKGLYTYIKQSDPYLEFAMLTGVSKFSKISLFSDLNNLNDITLDGRYADICGYNQVELEVSFREHLRQGDVDYSLLKRWYNGYNFTGSEAQKVYNPFDILLFIDNNYRYQAYWFETATPTYLIKLIQNNHYFIPELENLVVGEDVLKTFDIDNMPIETLLFQTGYLTVKQTTTIGMTYAYELIYPNLEVKSSLNNALAGIASRTADKNRHLQRLDQALFKAEFEILGSVFSAHFASIPNDWYRNNKIEQYEGSSRENEEHCSSPSDARSMERRAGIQASQDALGEGFYASIVYSFLAALGYDLIAEDVTNQGRIDLTLILMDKIIIIEFKLVKYGDATAAIEQIQSRGYAEKYQNQGKDIYLLGISFDPEARNVSDIRSVKTQ